MHALILNMNIKYDNDFFYVKSRVTYLIPNQCVTIHNRHVVYVIVCMSPLGNYQSFAVKYVSLTLSFD